MGFLLSIVCGSSTAFAEVSWKLYDLRDLMATIPSPVDLDRPLSTGAKRRLLSTRPPMTPQEARADQVDTIVNELAGRMGADFMPMLPGIYAVEAEEEQHVQLHRMLDELRRLYNERYEVEIVQYAVTAAEVPSLGQEVSPTSSIRQQRLVAIRRTPTPVEMVTHHAYIVDIIAVVASSAVGYAPEIDHVTEGFRVSLLVGAGDEDEETTMIHLVGSVRDVVMGKMSGPLEDGRAQLQVELPVERSRLIQSNIRIAFGKLTVLAVVDGFEQDSSIVVAAMVRKLEEW